VGAVVCIVVAPISACVYEEFMGEGSLREMESIMQWLIDIREIR